MAWYRHRQTTKEGPSMRCHSPVARWRLIVCQSNSSERSAQTTWGGCIASCLLRHMACSPVDSTIHVILDLCLSVQLVAYCASNFAGVRLEPYPSCLIYSDVLAFDLLGVCLPHGVLRCFHMPLIGSPAVRAIARDTKGRQQRFEFEEDRILPSAKDIRQHRACMVINGVP